MKERRIAILLLIVTVILGTVSVRPARANSTSQVRVARAVDYLVKRFNPTINLIYESDDPGRHWLQDEFSDFKWQYKQTYWVYSDNLFAAYALEPFRIDIAKRIKGALERRHVGPSGLFEAVIGETIPTTRNAVNYVVESCPGYVILARRHDSPVISYGLYADLICYRSLQLFLQGKTSESHRSLRQAICLWNGRVLDDWSYRVVDGFHSNQKLALLLYTSRVVGLRFATYAEMECHLWSMQQDDGGLAALSNGEGKPTGSSNTETTALALLIYNDALIHSVRSRVQIERGFSLGFHVVLGMFLSVTTITFISFYRRRHLSSRGVEQAW